MVLPVCLSVDFRRSWSRSVEIFCKSLSRPSGNRRSRDDDGGLPPTSTFSRLSSCGTSTCSPGPLVRWMASFVGPSKSVRSRRQGGATDTRPPSAMRKHRMGRPAVASAGGAAGGATCRGSTLLLSLLICFFVSFFVVFAFTFRGSQLSAIQELVASKIDGFKDDQGIVLEGRRRAEEDEIEAKKNISDVSVYGYEIVREYEHDPRAFTQGLLYAGNETLYESTGLYGQSTVREVDLLTGKVRRTQRMNKREFGEGLTLWEDRLYQVTWRNQKVFIYDQKTLAPRGEGTHCMKDGWGLTTSEANIIGSDGTSKLYFMMPETFEEVKVLTVRDDEKEVGWLNELEFVNGEIWANIWQGECIARISPENGKVTGWIVLQGLRSSLQARGAQNLDVLNGIAWDKEKDKLYVTGKMWPKIFEIELLEKAQDGNLDSIRTMCNIGQEGFT